MNTIKNFDTFVNDLIYEKRGEIRITPDGVVMTEDYVRRLSAKYKKLRLFKKENKEAYMFAKEHGFINELFSPDRDNKFDEDDIKDLAVNCENYIDKIKAFYRKYPDAYEYASTHRMLDELFPKEERLNKDKVKEEISKFSTIEDLYKSDTQLFSKAREYKLLDDFFTKKNVDLFYVKRKINHYIKNIKFCVPSMIAEKEPDVIKTLNKYGKNIEDFFPDEYLLNITNNSTDYRYIAKKIGKRDLKDIRAEAADILYSRGLTDRRGYIESSSNYNNERFYELEEKFFKEHKEYEYHKFQELFTDDDVEYYEKHGHFRDKKYYDLKYRWLKNNEDVRDDWYKRRLIKEFLRDMGYKED